MINRRNELLDALTHDAVEALFFDGLLLSGVTACLRSELLEVYRLRWQFDFGFDAMAVLAATGRDREH